MHKIFKDPYHASGEVSDYVPGEQSVIPIFPRLNYCSGRETLATALQGALLMRPPASKLRQQLKPQQQQISQPAAADDFAITTPETHCVKR